VTSAVPWRITRRSASTCSPKATATPTGSPTATEPPLHLSAEGHDHDGRPSHGRVADTPYQLREGSHVDPDGNLIRFGSPMPSRPAERLRLHLEARYAEAMAARTRDVLAR
jgi:hypothetical protein